MKDTSERPASHVESNEALRADLLERFAAHPFADLETYKYFNQKGEHARQTKEVFVETALGGFTPEAPQFIYPALDLDDLVAHRERLSSILQDLLRLDMNQEENRLLREKVTERMHEVGIMILTKLQSEMSADDPAYSAISYQLGENMREVYGAPEPEHWRGILGYRLSLLSAVENRDDAPEEVRKAWAFIRDHLPMGLPIEQPYQPRSDTIAWYGQRLDDRLAPAREAVKRAINEGEIALDENGKLDANNIIKATRIALQARGAHGWGAESTDESNIDTTQSERNIFIPESRVMSLKQFDMVIQSHEIDEHVMRRVNGDNSGEPILGGTGCSGYLAWEEGNGKTNEALLKGRITNEDAAFNYYISGGLVLGLDNPQKEGRNFGETFDLVWRMRYVSAFLEGKLPDDIQSSQRDIMSKTFDSLCRIFRGTDGQVPGVVFTKDAMTYYVGQTEVWRKWDRDMEALNEEDRVAEHRLERSAKINPLRPDHHRVAKRAMSQSHAF